MAGLPRLSSGFALRPPVPAGRDEGLAGQASPVAVKLKRAVHKLTLIRRFNQNADFSGAVGGGGTLMHSASSNRLGSGMSRRFSNAGSFFGRRSKGLGRTMDAYVKEQSNLYEYGRQRRVLNDDRLPRYIIRPNTTHKIMWDVLILVLVLYGAFTVPIRIGFESEPGEGARAAER
jgi:hypothetical protein